MTIEEALARHSGHWHRGRRVAVLNDAGDLLLISRDRAYDCWFTPPGSWIDVTARPMVPYKVDCVTGSDDEKIRRLHSFMGTRPLEAVA